VASSHREGTKRAPTAGLNVHHARNSGLPTGPEAQGNRAAIVVRGRESRPHGEGRQARHCTGREGTRNAKGRRGPKRMTTGEPDAVKAACPVREGVVGKVPPQAATRWPSTSCSGTGAVLRRPSAWLAMLDKHFFLRAEHSLQVTLWDGRRGCLSPSLPGRSRPSAAAPPACAPAGR
jgi:hypothetical protein